MLCRNEPLTFGSLFAGIGGFDLGFERAGLVCKWQVDNDAHCLDVRLRHWPDVPQFGDVKDVGRKQLEPVSVICGGFPCQDVSVAGRREGLAGERSGLWFEFLRVIEELEPEWVVVENVPGLLSSNGGRDMATIVGGLAECGYWWAYRVLDLQYFGVPQRRRRVFIVASLTRGRAQQVLFERESSPWDLAPGREARQELARDVAASLRNAGNGTRGWTGDNEQGLTVGTIPTTSPGGGCMSAFGGNNTAGSIDVAAARNVHGSNRYDFESETFVFEPRYARNGRGAPDNVVPPLKAESGRTGKGDGATLVAFDWRAGDDSKWHTGPNGQHPGGGAKEIVRQGDYTGALNSTRQDAVAGNFGVRRLTPVECERLQGFPDGHTDGQSDSARYRQLGNAVGVPHSEWIGQRIMGACREINST